MLFSKNLRKLALGLVVAAASAFGFAAPASADVFYDIASTAPNNSTGFLVGNPLEFFTVYDVAISLTGSDFGGLTGFTTGFLSFSTVSTGPTTAGPELPLSGTFSIYSGVNGTGTLLLTGTGASTLTRTSDDSVSWVGEPQVFTSDVIPTIGGQFALDFSLTNVDIPAGSTFPQFVAYAVSGSFTTVPEPSTFALLALGGLGLGVRAYRRRNVIAA